MSSPDNECTTKPATDAHQHDDAMSDQCENQEEDIIKATLEGYDDELEDDEFGAELRQYDDNKECSSSGAYRSIRHTESDDCSNHEQSNQPSSSTMSSVPNQSFTSSAYSSRHTDNDEEEDDDDEEDDEDDEDTRERKRLRFRSERAILTPKPQSNSSQIPDSLENVILDDEAKKAIEESEQKRPFVRNQHRTSRPGNVFGNQPQKNNKIYVNPHFRNNGGHNFINSNAKAGPLLNAPMDFPLQPFNNIIYPNVVGVRPCIQPPLIGPPMANFRDPNFNHPPLFNANTVDRNIPIIHPNFNGNANFFGPNQMPIFGQSPEFFALNDIGNGFPFSNHLGSHRPNFVPNVRHSNKPSFNRMPSQMNRQPHFNHNFNHNLNGKAPFLNPNNAMNSSTIQGRSSRPPLPVNSSGLPSPPPPIFAPNDESASPHNANRNQRTWIDRGVNTVPRTTLIQITSTTDPCSKSRLVPSSNQSTVSNAPKCSDSKQRTSLNNEFASNESADTTVIQKFQSKSTPKSSCSNVVGADGIQTTSAGPTLSLDEEYEKKLQEQKRKREEFLRQKEERRKQRSVQLANQHGGMSSPANASNLNKHVTVSHTSPATNFNPNHFNKFNDSQHHSSHLSNNGHFNRSNNNYKNYNQRNNNYNHNVENNKFGYQPRSNNNHNNNQPNYVRPSFKRRFTQQS